MPPLRLVNARRPGSSTGEPKNGMMVLLFVHDVNVQIAH